MWILCSPLRNFNLKGYWSKKAANQKGPYQKGRKPKKHTLKILYSRLWTLILKLSLSAKQTVFKPAKTIAERILSDKADREDVLRRCVIAVVVVFCLYILVYIVLFLEDFLLYVGYVLCLIYKNVVCTNVHSLFVFLFCKFMLFYIKMFYSKSNHFKSVINC